MGATPSVKLTMVVLGAALATPGAGPCVPHARYEPTPHPVVERMLDLAEVGPGDVVYDLGSGDGRIVIAAARRPGVRAVGVDLDPQRIRESTANAARAGVSDRVRFVHGDLFEADLREATVVTLYLLPAVNRALRPKLLEELRPGARIVSHAHDMGDWKPDREVTLQTEPGGPVYRLYLWVVPPR